MEFKIDRETFLEGLQKTLSITQGNSLLPFLNNVLISTGNNKVTISATNMEVGVVADYDAEIISEGAITLPARKLFEMVRGVSNKSVWIKQKKDSNVVKISGGKVKFNLPGIPSDAFPEILVDPDTQFSRIKNSIIAELIGKTAFAMSKDDARENLNGCFLEMEENKIKMVATDGHRLAIMESEIEAKLLKLDKGIIIPSKGINEIKRLIGEEIEIGIKDGFCVFKKENMFVKITLILADYPDYKRVLPKDKGIIVKLGKEQFLNSLERMHIVLGEYYSRVKINLSNGKMILDSSNPAVGEANEEIDIVYTGEDFEVGYNVNYLLDAVKVINGDEVMFEMRGDDASGTIKENDYLCIVMPIRTIRN